jgi:hypothetical protein
MQVDFYELGDEGSQRVGSIRWDGSRLSAEASEDKLLNRIMTEPIPEPMTGRALDPRKSPEEWLKNLQYQYRSAYLRASAPR